MTTRSLRIAAAALVAAGLGVYATAVAGPAPSGKPHLVVLGVDGLSADRVERLMAEGHLPNLAALAKRGGYSRLRTANPAQSPVSWASLTTGTNPGKTGIYDFLRRHGTKDGMGIQIDIGLAEKIDTAPLSPWLRVVLLGTAAAAGGAAALGVVMAIWSGARRARRPHGVLQGAATGGAALFASAGYVVLAWIPATVPTAHNLRGGEPFWQTLDRAGVRAVALEAPLSFPADEMQDGCCLSGLGTPDCQGTWGTFNLWTDDPEAPAKTETGGVSYFVEPGAKRFDLVLVGPLAPLADDAAVREARKAADVEKYKRGQAFDWTPARRRASETAEAMLRLADRTTVRIDAVVQSGKSVTLATPEGVVVSLAPGAWSDLVPVVFRLTPIAKLHARVRFLLESAGSAPTAAGDPWTSLKVFVGPVQFDPAEVPPNVKLSSPVGFSRDLAAKNGTFETLGWPEMTNPVKDGVLADREFLDHVDILRKGREKRLLERLGRNDWDCLFALFSEPDRVQHALLRHEDVKSPRHDPKAAPLFVGEIDRSYVEMDRVIGEAVAAAGTNTTVLVCSDHGFAPFRRGVNLNNFLTSIGMQIRSGGAVPKVLGEMQGGTFFEGVRWDETKAYAMGLGNVYLNLRGREAVGSVAPADAETVMKQIETALLALRDKDGTKVVRHVYRGRDLYHGDRAAEAPDLVVGFEWGYRVSWQNCLGAMDDQIITDNAQSWSGDHCSVDPELVPGVLFSSVPLDPLATPSVVDVVPSLLSLYGVAPKDTDGRSFFAR